MVKILIPDIHTTAAVLSTRVKEPNDTDSGKMGENDKYLSGTKGKYRTLSADDLK